MTNQPAMKCVQDQKLYVIHVVSDPVQKYFPHLFHKFSYDFSHNFFFLRCQHHAEMTSGGGCLADALCNMFNNFFFLCFVGFLCHRHLFHPCPHMLHIIRKSIYKQFFSVCKIQCLPQQKQYGRDQCTHIQICQRHSVPFGVP